MFSTTEPLRFTKVSSLIASHFPLHLCQWRLKMLFDLSENTVFNIILTHFYTVVKDKNISNYNKR